jgi:hypothetical protein
VGEDCGYVDKTGKVAIDLRFERSRGFREGLAATRLKTREGEYKWGYIDKTGKVVIPARFDAAWEFSGGLAPVKVGEKWGYINKKGDFVVPGRFDQAWPFIGALARVESGENVLTRKMGYIDTEGRWVWKPTN